MKALIFPLSKIIVGRGYDARLKLGAKGFLRKANAARYALGVISDEDIPSGRLTITRIMQLTGYKKTIFQSVAFNVCRDPLSVLEHHFALEKKEVTYTDYPLAWELCECGRLCFPMRIDFHNKKGLKYQYICMCKQTFEKTL